MAAAESPAQPPPSKTVGELRRSGYRTRTVKQELRDNLVRRLRDGGPVFPGIIGYEDVVIPQIVNAILLNHVEEHLKSIKQAIGA